MMQPQLVLQAKKRSLFGRGVKRLRHEGILPANIYGKKVKSLAIQVSTKDFEKVYKETGETGLIQLKVEKESKTRHVLATNLQIDPITDAPLHADFHQVDLKQKVTVAVPIGTRGESPAVKEKGAILIRLLNEVEVEALPQDLPDQFEVDISTLTEFDDNLLIKNLKVDKKKVVILTDGDEVIVMVQQPKKEEEEAPVEEEVPEEEEEKAEEEETAPTEEGAEPEKKGEGKRTTQETKAKQEK
ncbi:50S ribosomal protein L25 [Patescibacteria group bacterium]|nr:50S ribosomal protein L25 [Patescibacteria group bacterium]